MQRQKKGKDITENVELLDEKKKRQQWGWLNRYDFAYAGRDVVNQAAKVAPRVIKEATNDIDQIVRNRLNQAISSGRAEIERVLSKILRGATGDVYKKTIQASR